MIYVIGLLGFALAFLLPGHYFPWTGFQQDTVAASGAALTALAAVTTVREWPVRLPALACAVMLLSLVAPLQWAFGLVPYLSDALLPSAYLMAFALTIVTGLQLARHSHRFIGALFATFCAAAFLSVGLALAQWFGLGPSNFLEPLGQDQRMFANLAQPNHLASLLALGAAAVLWTYESRRVGGFVAALALGFLGWGMMMTQSRVAWLCVLVFVILWLLYRRRLALRTTLGAVVGACCLFIAMVLSWGQLNLLVQSDSSAVALAVHLKPAGYRLIHWETLVDALTRSPWFGYGTLQVPHAQLAAVLDHPVTFESLGSSHNQFLDLLLWNGLPLGLLVIAVIVWWAVSRMRGCTDIDSWASIACLGVLFAHAMVEFPFEYAYFLLPAGLLIGAIEARQPASNPPVRLNIGRFTFSAVALVLVSLLGMIVKEYVVLEEQVRRVRMRESGIIEQRGFEAVVPAVVLLDAPREYVRMWLTEQREGMSAAELDWLHTVSQRYPTPPALTRYAVAGALNGQADEATRALRILCRVHLPRECDQTRKRWAELAATRPALAAIPFPDTPAP